MKNRLEYQANKIEHVLAAHNAPAKITGGTVTPRWIRFKAQPDIGVKLIRIKNLAEELAIALDASNCRISRTGSTLAIEIPRDDPKPVRFIPLHKQLTDNSLQPIPPATAILGLAEDGAPLLIRLPSPDVAHILVAGTTGSGKTVLLQTIVTSLVTLNTPTELGLILIDPKRHAFTPFQNVPHLTRPIASEPKEITELLQSLIRLMDHRGAKTSDNPIIVVVIDEIADILLTGNKQLHTALTRLTQRGREAGIHVIAATQKPTAAVLGPLIKANFPVRLVGKVTCAEDAKTASGWTGTGAERLSGRGDFLAIAEGRTTHFQGAHITRAEIEQIVSHIPKPELAQTKSIHIPPPPQPQPSTDEVLAQQLTEWHRWPKRFRPNKTTYVWGFQSAACTYLFEQPLAGNRARQIKRILPLAEAISSTSTPKRKQKHKPNHRIYNGESGRSRNSHLFTATKPAISTTMLKPFVQTFTDRELLMVIAIATELAIIIMLTEKLL